MLDRAERTLEANVDQDGVDLDGSPFARPRVLDNGPLDPSVTSQPAQLVKDVNLGGRRQHLHDAGFMSAEDIPAVNQDGSGGDRGQGVRPIDGTVSAADDQDTLAAECLDI